MSFRFRGGGTNSDIALGPTAFVAGEIISVFAYVRPVSATGYLYFHGDSNIGIRSYIYFIDNGGGMTFGFTTPTSNGPTNGQWEAPANSLPLGTAHSIGVSYNFATGGTPNLVVDGAPVAVTQITPMSGPPYPDSFPFALGNRDLPFQAFDGWIAHFAMWSRRLFNAEWATAHASGPGRVPGNRVVYYTTEGDPTKDSSGSNGNTLFLANPVLTGVIFDSFHPFTGPVVDLALRPYQPPFLVVAVPEDVTLYQDQPANPNDPILHQAPSTTYTYTGSGGAVLSGAATISKVFVYPPGGGLTTGGGADVLKIFVYPPSGGLTFGGTATIAKTFVYPPSGGAVFSGTADVAKVFVYPVTGGLTTGGAATISKVFVYPPSGGLTGAGTATIEKTKVYPVSGGAVLNGTAAVAKVKVYTPTGGAVLAGSATVEKAFVYPPSGGLVAAGTATVEKTKVYPPSGGAVLNGAATTSFTPGTIIFVYTPSGGAVLSGAALTQFIPAFTPSPDYAGGGGPVWWRHVPQPERRPEEPSPAQVFEWVTDGGGLALVGSAVSSFRSRPPTPPAPSAAPRRRPEVPRPSRPRPAHAHPAPVVDRPRTLTEAPVAERMIPMLPVSPWSYDQRRMLEADDEDVLLLCL